MTAFPLPWRNRRDGLPTMQCITARHAEQGMDKFCIVQPSNNLS